MNSQITSFFFNLLLLPFYLPLFLYTLWRRFGQKKSAASFAGQWGIVPTEVRAALHGNREAEKRREEVDESPAQRTPIIWLHAVSVGESIAARPIARALKNEIPACRIGLSCTTDTGFQTAQAALQAGEVDATFYFPLDLPIAVSRALKAIGPDVFLAVETELWPNFLDRAQRRGVLCLLVNGRVSDSMLKSALKIKFLWRWILSNLDALLMRSEFDATRARQICDGVGYSQGTQKVLAPGDVKLDQTSSHSEQIAARQKWRALLKIRNDELLWVCGSTHPARNEKRSNAHHSAKSSGQPVQSSEEFIALRVYQNLRKKYRLRLLIAPRHIERTDEVLALAESLDIPMTRRSEIDTLAENSDGQQVLLLDSVGELSELYAAADVAFVGGSLIPRGGHNVLEPVLRGVPVLFGPHVANFREPAALVINEKLGEQVGDEDELQKGLEFLLNNADARAEITLRAERALQPHQGAAARIAKEVAKRLKLKAENSD